VHRVLRVLRAKCGDGRRVFRRVVGQGGAPVDADPGESRPVLVPAVDEDRDLGAALDVANARQRARVRGRLRLLVDRREDRVTVEHEADRDETGPSVLGDRRQGRSPGAGHELSLVVAQRHRRSIARRSVALGQPFERVAARIGIAKAS